MRLRDLCNSPYAGYVHQIDLGFPDIIKIPSEAQLSYADDLAALLPGWLAKLPNLSSIGFQAPPANFPYEKTQIFISAVVAALRYVPLLKLAELDIIFPCSYDIAKLFCSSTSSMQIPIEDVLRRLRYLGLAVLADGSDDERSTPSLSEMHLFNLVKLAKNLESLTLHSDADLNLDGIQFASSLRLKYLSLFEVTIPSQVLIPLLEQCRDSMIEIELDRVDLSEGTWCDVFQQLCKSPALLGFSINWGGYSLDGMSGHLAAEGTSAQSAALLQAFDDEIEVDIVSKSRLDYTALVFLQRHVSAKRAAGGSSLYRGSQ